MKSNAKLFFFAVILWSIILNSIFLISLELLKLNPELPTVLTISLVIEIIIIIRHLYILK